MRIKGLALWALSAVIAIGAHAQIEETDSWRLGISAGLHTSFMRISDLDKEIFPKSNELGAGVFSVFVQKAWGEDLNWAIRPELAFTNRGGSLVKIMSQVPGYYEEHALCKLAILEQGQHVIISAFPASYLGIYSPF